MVFQFSDEEIRRAFALFERGRRVPVYRLLRRLGPVMVHAGRDGRVSSVFPILGICDGLIDRGGLRPWSMGRRSSLFRRLMLLPLNCSLCCLLRLWLFLVRRHLQRRWPRRPGWNDYYMVRWQVTGKPEYLLWLYRRAVEVPAAPAGLVENVAATEDRMGPFTCRWMLNSVRGRDPDLDAALRALESQYGVPLVAPDAGDLNLARFIVP